jgi:peptide/nickel transport system permease protein
MIIAILLIAIAAPALAPADPTKQSVRLRLQSPSWDHPFGLDDYGRDIFSRVIYGTRIALQVGLFSVALGGIVGTAVGVAAGYFGGRIEAALMRLVDILLSFPDLITGLLVLAVLGPGLWKMILAIGLTIAPRFARLAHGPTLSIKKRDFVDAARALGVGHARIVRVHILPNVAGELIVLGSLWTGSKPQLHRTRRAAADTNMGADDPRWHGLPSRRSPVCARSWFGVTPRRACIQLGGRWLARRARSPVSRVGRHNPEGFTARRGDLCLG